LFKKEEGGPVPKKGVRCKRELSAQKPGTSTQKGKNPEARRELKLGKGGFRIAGYKGGEKGDARGGGGAESRTLSSDKMARLLPISQQKGKDSR